MAYNVNLPEKALTDIKTLAEKCDLEKVILFGPRARGDNRAKSDIDLAVSGGKTDEFRCLADEEVYTLLMFDIVDLDGPVQLELMRSIEREGVVIYEKV